MVDLAHSRRLRVDSLELKVKGGRGLHPVTALRSNDGQQEVFGPAAQFVIFNNNELH